MLHFYNGIVLFSRKLATTLPGRSLAHLLQKSRQFCSKIEASRFGILFQRYFVKLDCNKVCAGVDCSREFLRTVSSMLRNPLTLFLRPIKRHVTISAQQRKKNLANGFPYGEKVMATVFWDQLPRVRKRY